MTELESLASIETELDECEHSSDNCLVCWVPSRVRRLLKAVQGEVDSRYMELPSDARNEPWRIGDKFGFAGADGRKHVCTVSGIGDGEVFFYYDEHSDSTKHRHFNAKAIHHVKQRTVEDVLREFAYKVCDLNVSDDAIAAYAAELQMREERFDD